MFLTDGLPSRSYDCYVIGAGPAGITLSLELAKANRTVLVFETGTVTEARDDMPNAVNYGHFPDGWWDRHSIRVLGGTSRVWNGVCATLMDVDFANPAAGVRWPITKSDLAPHYRRAASVCGPRTFHPRCRNAAHSGIRLPAVFPGRFRGAL